MQQVLLALSLHICSEVAAEPKAGSPLKGSWLIVRASTWKAPKQPPARLGPTRASEGSPGSCNWSDWYVITGRKQASNSQRESAASSLVTLQYRLQGANKCANGLVDLLLVAKAEASFANPGVWQVPLTHALFRHVIRSYLSLLWTPKVHMHTYHVYA